jgi:CPA2 family monovalent cation:H+ antiporter-2
MEFSLKHLMRIRRVVFLGGLMQVSLTAAIFFVASRFWHSNILSGVFIGLIVALSSSALVLKILQERSEITSNYGRTVVGILIFQDLMLVPLLLFTNLIGGDSLDIQREILSLLLKAIIIVSFVYVGNKWLLPKLLHIIAMTRNQELFMMSIFLICLGVAWITSEMGMSLAFGAFLAGLMISESEYSHNAFGDLVAFKDTFTSFFFVSIGMMLNMHFVIDNYILVIVSVLLIIGIKTLIAGATGFALGHTFKGTVMVGLALSQIGEFSFILAKLGLQNGVIPEFYYQLFLAVSVTTMAMSPFLIQGAPRLADLLLKLPLPEKLRKGLFPLPEIEVPDLNNHLVIIGKDTSALKLSVMAKHVNLPYAAIVFDPSLIRERQKNGEIVIYGDAVNLPVLEKAHVDTSDVVVISVGDIIPAMAILEKVRQLSSNAYIVVRAKQTEDIEKLYELGADQVMPEKLEIAIDLFTRILTHRLFTQSQIRKITNDIRENYYGIFREKDVNNKPSLFDELEHLEVAVITVDENSEVAKIALNDSRLRNRSGITILSIKRDSKLIEHPDAQTVLCSGDIVYVLGTNEQITKARELFSE